MSNNNNWGGYRPGSGRPSTNRPHTITIKCASDVYDILSEEGRAKSAYIEKAVRAYHNERLNVKLKHLLCVDGEGVSRVNVYSRQDMGEAEFVKATLTFWEGDDLDVAFVIYKDGETWFSPYDWQGVMPEPTTIPDTAWMVGATGQRAVVLDGLPRKFP